MPILGDAIPVAIQLYDGDASLFVKATIRDATGTIIGSILNVPAVGSNGQYQTEGPAMPDTPFVTVEYQVFQDAGFTQPATTYSNSLDTWELFPEGGSPTPSIMGSMSPGVIISTANRQLSNKNPLIPLGPLKNACDVYLNQNSGTLPNVTDAILNYFQQMTFSLIRKNLGNFTGFYVQEATVNIICYGMMQTHGRRLMMTKDGQRLWRNQTLYCESSVILKPDDVVVYLGVQYRVLERENWIQYGFIKYGLAEDFTGEGPFPVPA